MTDRLHSILVRVAHPPSADTVFLFSLNRLNVGISRARCLACLICTEGLLIPCARSVEKMRLIATRNTFVEWVT